VLGFFISRKKFYNSNFYSKSEKPEKEFEEDLIIDGGGSC
jgi:hypothetical protein